MTARIDFSRLEEIGSNPQRREVVWLNKPLLNNEEPDRKQSGLINISGVKQFQRVVQHLTWDMKSWIELTSGQPNEEFDETLGQNEAKHKIFHDPEECLRYIRSNDRSSIILILSPYHTEDEMIFRDFGRIPQIFKICI